MSSPTFAEWGLPSDSEVDESALLRVGWLGGTVVCVVKRRVL